MLYLVYAFMFICSLAMILYTAALGVKLSVRLRNPMSRILLALLIPACAALPGVALSMLSQNVCDPYFMSALSCSETGGVTLTWVHRTLIGWTAAAGLGSLIVLAMGFQSRGWTPVSNDWHAEGLFLRAVMAMVLTVALFFGADTLVTRELKSELAWYQKLYDWTEPLPPEGGEEGRKAYIAAYTAMQRIFNAPEGGETALPEWWDEAFKSESELDLSSYEVRKFVWDNKGVYDLIANAASAPVPDMSDEERNSFLPLDPLAMGKMLYLSALVNAERGWFISAVRDIGNIIKLDHQNRENYFLTGYFYSLLLRGYALGALEETVSKAGFYGIDPALYPEFDDIAGFSLLKAHVRRQQTAITGDFLNELTAPAVKEKGQSERFKKILYRAFMASQALICIKSANLAEETSLSEGLFSIADMKGKIGRCEGYLEESDLVPIGMLKFKLVGSRGAELALATVKYYRKHKRYPADISELAPAFIESIPADPYDDKGTMAMADEDGVLLFYSPGYEKFKGERIGFRLKKQ